MRTTQGEVYARTATRLRAPYALQTKSLKIRDPYALIKSPAFRFVASFATTHIASSPIHRARGIADDTFSSARIK